MTPPNPSEAAREAAALILKEAELIPGLSEYHWAEAGISSERMAEIIESAISQSLAARDKEIEELAARWDSDAEVREAFDAKQLARNFRVDTRVLRDCASELLALLKGKAI